MGQEDRKKILAGQNEKNEIKPGRIFGRLRIENLIQMIFI
jgi:hypothetical protein